METLSHILWPAVNKYEKKKFIIMKKRKEKGLGILFGQFVP
jgi:hypothetical protein